MSTYRLLARAGALSATVAIGGLLAAGTASAHVTANVYGAPAAQGGYTAIALRVPNEEAKAGTVKVSVSIDPDYAIGGARTTPVAGWTSEIIKTELDKPVAGAHGAEIKEVVTKIVWTAKPGNEIKAGETEYREFPFTLGPLPTDVDTLVLPADQFYQGGKVVRWNEAPTSDGAELERPAPVVTLAPAEEAHGATDAKGSHAAPAAHEAAAMDEGVDSTARWLGGAGLVVGALGLGFGVGRVIRSRSNEGGPQARPSDRRTATGERGELTDGE